MAPWRQDRLADLAERADEWACQFLRAVRFLLRNKILAMRFLIQIKV